MKKAPIAGSVRDLVNIHTGEVEKYYVRECDPGTPYACTRAWHLSGLTRAGVPDNRVRGTVVGARVGTYGASGTLAAYDPVRESVGAGLRERVLAARAALARAELELFALYAGQEHAA